MKLNKLAAGIGIVLALAAAAPVAAFAKNGSDDRIGHVRGAHHHHHHNDGGYHR